MDLSALLTSSKSRGYIRQPFVAATVSCKPTAEKTYMTFTEAAMDDHHFTCSTDEKRLTVTLNVQ